MPTVIVQSLNSRVYIELRFQAILALLLVGNSLIHRLA